MRTSRKAVGAWGENAAAEYMQQKGYRITGRNVRTRYGEIDLIACQERGQEPAQFSSTNHEDEVIVFVEVKTRRSTSFGFPEAAVNRKKQAHLVAAVQAYLQANPELVGAWRVDVIAVEQHGKDEPVQITHFENAITSEGFEPPGD